MRGCWPEGRHTAKIFGAPQLSQRRYRKPGRRCRRSGSLLNREPWQNLHTSTSISLAMARKRRIRVHVSRPDQEARETMNTGFISTIAAG